MHKKSWTDNPISPLKRESESTNLIKWGQWTRKMTEELLTAALCPAGPQGHIGSFDAINWLSGHRISPLDVNGILSFWKGRYCSKQVKFAGKVCSGWHQPTTNQPNSLLGQDADVLLSEMPPIRTLSALTCGSSSFLSGYLWEIIQTFTVLLSLNVLWKP